TPTGPSKKPWQPCAPAAMSSPSPSGTRAMGRAPTSLALALLGGLAAALLSATPAAAQQAQPTIVGIGVTGCVNVGDRVTVRGSGFGRAGGKALVLRDPNTSVELPVSNWTDR